MAVDRAPELEEASCELVAPDPQHLNRPGYRYRYCEFDPIMSFGEIVSTIPHIDQNMAVRNSYSFSQQRAAFTIYSTAHRHQFESSNLSDYPGTRLLSLSLCVVLSLLKACTQARWQARVVSSLCIIKKMLKLKSRPR